jgi:hypothetical protein
MLGDPKECRLTAARCLRLAELASNPVKRHSLDTLAATWTKLAAELESDQALLNALLALELGEPHYELAVALKLRAA